MTKPLTVEQHQQILERLLALVKNHTQIDLTNKVLEEKMYLILMVGFLNNSISISKTLLNLIKSLKKVEDFPVSVGYVIVRPLFETAVNASYIAKNPDEYVQQYIEFENILKYQKMKAIDKHRNSKKDDWKEGMDALFNEYTENNKSEIENNYQAVLSKFSHPNKKGKLICFKNWSGKPIAQMAKDKDVDCEEPFDILYSELSSFTHIDVSVVNMYLKTKSGKISLDMKANVHDVNNVFRYAVMFLTDFLKLFGEEFNTWQKLDVDNCWEFE